MGPLAFALVSKILCYIFTINVIVINITEWMDRSGLLRADVIDLNFWGIWKNREH
jgi:hypothetical protein